MFVLTSTPPILDFFKDRLSSSSSSSSSTSTSTSAASSSSSPSPFSVVVRRNKRYFSPKLNSIADTSPSPSPSAATSVHEAKHQVLFHTRHFFNVRFAHDLISVMKRESEFGTFPKGVAASMEEVFYNYRNAVHSSGIPHPDEVVLSNIGAMLDLVLLDLEDPFVFQSYHKAVREPIDYYLFGQNYFRPLIDFKNSYVGNISVFQEMELKLQQGHNIVLMSNHQTEADPAVIALLLEKTNPYIGENMIYVAGDRVITDPLCKPFSRGRNLLCVYSKKHMYDVPELIEVKKRANTKSLKELALLLRGGSKIIWIAPSGGRDRPDPVTGEWYPATFDLPSVNNMRRLVEHAGIPGHIYPLSLLCYDIMPPPAQVEKEIGERRIMSYHGVGLSVGPEINYHEISLSSKEEEEVKSAYAEELYTSVNQQYNILKAAVHGKEGLSASKPAISLSQPWTC